MTVTEVLAEGEQWQSYDTPVVLSVYALYRTMRNTAHVFELLLLELDHQNRVLSEWNRKLAEENERLKRAVP